MLQTLIRLLAISLFVLSPSLLYGYGIDYVGSSGNAYEKLHPSLYLAVLLLGLTLVITAQGQVKIPEWIKGLYKIPVLLSGFALLITAALGRSGAGDLSAVAVTFVLPALLAYILQFATAKTARFLRTFILVFFFINSCVGMVESLTEWRLLPYYVGDQLIAFDDRPTAIIGHPLSDALLTGALILVLMMQQISLGLKTSVLLQIALHTAAMFAFGGRASLILMLIFMTIYTLRHTGLVVKVEAARSRRSIILVFMAALLFAALSVSGFTTTLLERFLTATGSTNTRFAALTLIDTLQLQEWVIGVEPSARLAYLAALNTPFGIEISPIAMVFSYGLPLTALLLFATYRLLFKTAKKSFPGARYVVAFFIVSTWAALSIGSKSLLISQLLIMMFALHPQMLMRTAKPETQDTTDAVKV